MDLKKENERLKRENIKLKDDIEALTDFACSSECMFDFCCACHDVGCTMEYHNDLLTCGVCEDYKRVFCENCRYNEHVMRQCSKCCRSICLECEDTLCRSCRSSRPSKRARLD